MAFLHPQYSFTKYLSLKHVLRPCPISTSTSIFSALLSYHLFYFRPHRKHYLLKISSLTLPFPMGHPVFMNVITGFMIIFAFEIPVLCPVTELRRNSICIWWMNLDILFVVLRISIMA